MIKFDAFLKLSEVSVGKTSFIRVFLICPGQICRFFICPFFGEKYFRVPDLSSAKMTVCLWWVSTKTKKTKKTWKTATAEFVQTMDKFPRNLSKNRKIRFRFYLAAHHTLFGRIVHHCTLCWFLRHSVSFRCQLLCVISQQPSIIQPYF